MAKAAKCGDGKPRRKPKPKPKLSDEARHKRFVEMTREVDADEASEAFDRAFHSVVRRDTKPNA
jgi:hypothetical protein